MRFPLLALVLLAAALMPAAAVAADPPVPEFDGCYLVPVSGPLAQVKVTQRFTSMVVKPPMNITALMAEKDRYYALDAANAATVKASAFRGLAVKGGADRFKSFGLYPVVEVRPAKEGLTLFENKGPGKEDGVLLFAGGAPADGGGLAVGNSAGFALRAKSLAPDAYYWEPEAALKPGRYVFWANSEFYFVTVTE
ncbi:MAG: hypothetical protein HY928_06695 [Elusimicrobia bacterium]|nr:hypothetical protein [Elusimicrobiota bacterium]